MANQELLGESGEKEHTVVGKRDSDHRILARLQKRKDWIIPERSWQHAPETLQTFLEDDDNEVRERISAARTLVMMSNSGIAGQSVEVRINQALAVVTPPAAPDDVDVEIQPAFIEQVTTDDLGETVGVLESLGLLDRYVDQVKTSAVPSTNGNGNGKSHS